MAFLFIPSGFRHNLSPTPTTHLGLDAHPSEWHIYLHEWLIFIVNVGKYASDMDPMGLKLDEVRTGCTSST